MTKLSIEPGRPAHRRPASRILIERYVGELGILAVLLCGWLQAVGQEVRRPVLTHAAEIRTLPLEAKELGRAARVRGIITYRDQLWNFMVLQDESGGVPVVAFGAELPLAIGNRVEVEGVTGLFYGAFGIDQPTVRLIEKATLPEPRPATLPELEAGRYDAMRVELAGVISATEVVQNHVMLHLRGIL